LKPDEALEEEPTITKEKVYKIECNIGMTTNYMHSGITDVRRIAFTCLHHFSSLLVSGINAVGCEALVDAGP
jgi:hypothetical protein